MIVFRTDLHARNIAQIHRRTVGIGAQNNILKLLRRFQPRLRGHGRVQRLAIHRRQCANLTAGDLGILRFYRGLHVRWHQAITAQLDRIEPNAHRILSAKYRRLPDAIHPAQRILQRTDQKIIDINAVHAALRVVQGDYH